jgi:ankyrin repeat protein
MNFYKRLFGHRPRPSLPASRTVTRVDQIKTTTDASRQLMHLIQCSESWLPEQSQVEALIAQGADVNTRTDDGSTALMLAAFKNKSRCLRLLISAGADVNAKDSEGRAALNWAINYGPYVDCVRALISSGADINAKDNKGLTVLYWAVLTANLGCVQALISAGADVNAKDDNSGWTALMRAANEPSVDCVRVLIAAGAEVNARDRDGKTALAWARTTGRRNDENAGDYENVIAALKAAGAQE